MAILNIFKKEEEKKAKKEAPKEKKTVPKAVKTAATKTRTTKPKRIKKEIPEETKKEAVVQQPADKTKQSVLAAEFILHPHITEQSTSLTSRNVYTFRVSPTANKIIIKKAVKEMYGFKPVKVCIINVPAKKRTVRGRIGIKSGSPIPAITPIAVQDKQSFSDSSIIMAFTVSYNCG